MPDVDRECPWCHGVGEHSGIGCGCRDGKGSCAPMWFPCLLCAGSGRVSEATLGAYEAGRVLREDRVRRGVTLRDEARRLGVSMPELSRREWGRGS